MDSTSQVARWTSLTRNEVQGKLPVDESGITTIRRIAEWFGLKMADSVSGIESELSEWDSTITSILRAISDPDRNVAILWIGTSSFSNRIDVFSCVALVTIKAANLSSGFPNDKSIHCVKLTTTHSRSKLFIQSTEDDLGISNPWSCRNSDSPRLERTIKVAKRASTSATSNRSELSQK